MCLLCEISQRQESAVVVYEDRDLMAVKDKYPRDPVHILIFPKKHISLKELQEKDKDLIIQMILLAKKLASKHKVSAGYELAFNAGNYAHFEHLHLHLMGGGKRT